MRSTRKIPAKAEGAPQARHFYIVDTEATEIAGRPVTKDMLKNGLPLTDAEAMSYIASGTITTTEPSADKPAANAVAAKADTTKPATPAAKSA